MKAFVIPDGNDKLWMYRRGLNKPVPVSRDDAAATRDFYSRPAFENALTLDDLITEYETTLQYLVDDLRALHAGAEIPTDTIAEVVAHLTMRTAYLREFVKTGAKEMILSIDKVINRPDEILGGIEFLKHKVPQKLEALIIEQLEKHDLMLLTKVSPKAISRLLFHAMREDFDLLKENAYDEFTFWLDQLGANFATLGRDAHTRVLQDEIVPTKRKAQLANLKWMVVKCSQENAILPDCVAISKDKNGWGPYILSDFESMEYVVMPIAPDRFAVGSTSQNWVEAVVSYGQNSVKSCFTFFLSDHLTETSDTHLEELEIHPRSQIADLTSSAVREVIGEFVGDLIAVNVDGNPQKTWEDIDTDAGLSYVVSFKDVADENTGKEVAAVVQDVVSAFTAYFPVSGLDGITFAYDYVSALRDLDRGEGTNHLADASAGLNPNGVGMPLVVRRNGKIKTHIVLRGYFADDLLSENQSRYDDAVSTLYYCLGAVAYYSLVETKFPGTVLSPHSDPYEGWLAQYNDTLLSSYFSQLGLRPNPELLEFYSVLALEQLDALVTVTHVAQKEYGLNGDHERYFVVCAERASSFLSALVRLFSARTTQIGPPAPNSLLEERLSQLELSKWASLFEKDIFSFVNDLDSWKNFEEIYFLNRHFERLLFEVGVLPDQLEDGSFFVHTSHEHRLALRDKQSVVTETN